LGEEFQDIQSHLQGAMAGLERGLRSDYAGAKCVYDAYVQALQLAPEAILKETGYEISSLLSGLIPGLLQMVVIVGATTFLGATVGGVVGFFFGGAGAVPGAAVGADIGLDAGVAILTWLGVGFLLVSIAKGFAEMLEALRNGIEWAWAARNLPKAAEAKQVSAAAFELARTVGILVRLILQGIVSDLLKKAAVGATRSALATGKALQADGAAAVSGDIVAELIGKLRVSKFGGRFADWVDGNWPDMVRNLRLRETQSPKPSLGTGGGGGDAREAGAVPPKAKVVQGSERLKLIESDGPQGQNFSDFTAERPEGPVNLDHLSADDKLAQDLVRQGGRTNRDEIANILDSGENFKPYQFKEGQKLYAFDSLGRGKPVDSAYWLDENGFNDVKGKYEKDGVWDRQGVKNYLALPCNNRADTIVEGVVKQANTGVESTVSPAEENVTNIAPDGTVVPSVLELPGGGKQVTPGKGTVVPAGNYP
jgi:hypothetical protein